MFTDFEAQRRFNSTVTQNRTPNSVDNLENTEVYNQNPAEVSTSPAVESVLNGISAGVALQRKSQVAHCGDRMNCKNGGPDTQSKLASQTAFVVSGELGFGAHIAPVFNAQRAIHTTSLPPGGSFPTVMDADKHLGHDSVNTHTLSPRNPTESVFDNLQRLLSSRTPDNIDNQDIGGDSMNHENINNNSTRYTSGISQGDNTPSTYSNCYVDSFLPEIQHLPQVSLTEPMKSTDDVRMFSGGCNLHKGWSGPSLEVLRQTPGAAQEQACAMLHQGIAALPLSSAEHDQRVLCSARGSGEGVKPLPECSRGLACVGNLGIIPGTPLDSTGNILMRYLSPDHLRTLLENPDSPSAQKIRSHRGLCLLCLRCTSCEYLAKRAALGSSCVVDPSRIFQLFRSEVATSGGYKRNSMFNVDPEMWSGFMNPVVMFEPSRLRWERHHNPDDTLYDGRWRVNQDQLVFSEKVCETVETTCGCPVDSEDESNCSHRKRQKSNAKLQKIDKILTQSNPTPQKKKKKM
jgi:hypothetical protein